MARSDFLPISTHPSCHLATPQWLALARSHGMNVCKSLRVRIKVRRTFVYVRKRNTTGQVVSSLMDAEKNHDDPR